MRRIGLMGFGKIAEHGHLPAWEALGCEIVAVADLSAARRDRARELLPDIQVFEEPSDLFERSAADVLDLCTPPSTHAELIVEGCRRGMDVVSEKPLVLLEDDYLRVARARYETGRRVVSINNWLHSDLFRYVAGLLKEGAVGEIRRIELRTGRPDSALGSDGWMPRWRVHAEHSGGGVMLDHGWHQLYMLLGWMQAPVQEVSATTATVDPRHAPVEDEACIDLAFPQASGRIELSWVASERTNAGSISGSEGELTIHDDGLEIRNGKGRQEVRFQERLTQSSYHPDWFESTFQSSILSRHPNEADRNLAEAGILVGIIRAAYHAAGEGTSVHPRDLAAEATESLEKANVYSSRSRSAAQ